MGFAAYSGAKAVVLVLMDHCTSAKHKNLSDSDQMPGARGTKSYISERKWAMLASATSLVVTCSYGMEATNASATSQNLKNTWHIINHIKDWVQGRDCIGMSIESCQAGRSQTRKMPAVCFKDAMESSGGKLNIPLASLSAAKHQALTRNIDQGSFVESQANMNDTLGVRCEPVFLVNNMHPPTAKLMSECPIVPKIREANNCVSYGLPSQRAYRETEIDLNAKPPQCTLWHERNLPKTGMPSSRGSTARVGKDATGIYIGPQGDCLMPTQVSQCKWGDRRPHKQTAEKSVSRATRFDDKLEDLNCDRSTMGRKYPSSSQKSTMSDLNFSKMTHAFHHSTKLVDMGDVYEIDML